MSTTLHITPAGSGEWAIRINETAGASSVHPTQAQAVAGAWEQLRDLAEAEVIVHDSDGRARSSLIIRQVVESHEIDHVELDLDDSDDPAARAEALRITPSNARLKAGIARRLSVEGADLDADPADLTALAEVVDRLYPPQPEEGAP